MKRNVFALTLAAAMLTACNGGGSTTPAAAPANLSGDYTGTLQDAQAGSGPVTATFAQHGTSVGGRITTASTGRTLDAEMALVVSSSNDLSGSIVIDESNGTVCTFSTTGSYDTSTNVITGSYTAVTNCSGDTGTYTLTQQCYDTVTSDRRTMGLRKC